MAHRKVITMNQDTEIIELKARIDALEDEVILLHESTNKRIDDMQHTNSQKLTIWSIVVAVIIGIIQLGVSILALLKK